VDIIKIRRLKLTKKKGTQERFLKGRSAANQDKTRSVDVMQGDASEIVGIGR
jgi:hypothetical protein